MPRIPDLNPDAAPTGSDLIPSYDSETNITKRITLTQAATAGLAGGAAYVPGGTDVPIVDGGTGASTAADARTNLGLGNVDNTSDLAKPVSTATQTALDAKAPLLSPALTGIPTAPTAAAGTNTTQIASTAYTTAAVVAGATPDATTLVKGKIQLAGDLGGVDTTAASPIVKNVVKVFNVHDYGAKGDGLTRTDGAMVVGSGVLTSVSGMFTSVDVGKLIEVVNASANASLTTAIASASVNTSLAVTAVGTALTAGQSIVLGYGSQQQTVVTSAAVAAGELSIPVNSFTASFAYPVGTPIQPVSLVTTIASFQSATQVTLTTNAKSTVTGQSYTYGTNDTTSIQSALDASNAVGGGIVSLNNGNYTMGDELIVYSNTVIKSVVPRKAILNGSTMALTPKTGQGSIARWWIIRTPNDTTPRSNITVDGIKFVGRFNRLYTATNYTDQTKQQNGIGFRYLTNVSIINCEFYNIRTAVLAGVPYNGGQWDAGTSNNNVLFNNNYVELCQGGLQVYSVNTMRFVGNRFKTLADDCMAALGDCENVIVIQNDILTGALDNGLGILASCNMFKVDSGTNTTASGKISVYDNRAIAIHRGVVVTQGANMIDCHHNRFTNCHFAGIQIANSNDVKVNNNYVESCNKLLDPAIAAIYVLAVNKARILNNDVLGTGTVNENGIRTVNIPELDIVSNQTSTGGYGINVDTTTNLLFKNNTNIAVTNSTRGFLTAGVTGRGWFIDNVTSGTFTSGPTQISSIGSITDKRFRGNTDVRDEGNYLPRFISVRTISGLVTGNTLLYIVPTGKRLVVTSILIRVGGATGTNTGVPSISIGGNSTAFDDFLPNQQLTNVVTTSKMFAYTPSYAVTTYAQGTNINLAVNTAGTGNTSLTYDIDVFGELV